MFRHTFRALSHRAFRRYFIGQGVSQTGNWIQQVVLSWLAYENSGSALWLGLVVERRRNLWGRCGWRGK